MTKLIKKYTPTRAGVPVLNTVQIKNGVATCTDMEYTLAAPAPNGVTDGLYSPVGLYEGLPHRSEIAADEFPAPNKKFNMDTLAELDYERSVLLEKLKFVLPAVSHEEVRYFLCGVNFNASDIVATTGHILKRTANPQPCGSIIIPYNAVKIMIDVMTEQKNIDRVTLEIKQQGVVFRCGKFTLTSTLIDANYADYKRAIPNYDTHTRTVLDVNKLKAIKPQLEILFKQRDSVSGLRAVTLIENRLECCGQSFDIGTQVKEPVSFTLKNLLAVGGGDFYTDGNAPAIIDSPQGQAVIMPCRI